MFMELHSIPNMIERRSELVQIGLRLLGIAGFIILFQTGY